MVFGLREANQQFAKVIRAVRAGREVVLTHRGKPLAVIRPVSASDDEISRIAAMTAEGLVTPPSERGAMPAPRWQPERLVGLSIAVTVATDRSESA